MQELIAAIRNGDRRRLAERYTELYERNTGLLYSLARRYYTACQLDRAIDTDDLMQAGFIGLMAAVEAWEPERGAWSTIATMYIKRHMRAALGIQSGRPSKLHMGALSLDRPLTAEDDTTPTMGDMLEDDTLPGSDAELLQGEIVSTMRAAVDALPGTQSQAVQLHYLQGQSFRATAEVLGCTPSQTRTIEGNGFRNLRRSASVKALMRAYHLDEQTRFFAHKSYAAFATDWTSVTEAAALWRMEQTEPTERTEERKE